MYKVNLLSDAGAIVNGSTFQMPYNSKAENLPVQIAGITNATVRIEGSFDGSTFDVITGTNVTADACITVPVAYPFMRAAVTAWVSGSITVTMGY